MTDQEILDYSHAHRDVYYDDLKRDVIDTSPQIIGVYKDYIFDHITIVTPDSQFTFSEKFTKKIGAKSPLL